MKESSQKPLFLNAVEIGGVVGRSAVTGVGDTRVCRFSVLVEEATTDRSGNPFIECLWLNVTAWEGKDTGPVENIVKGANVHLKGRIRCYRYTAADGTDRTSWDVIAKEVRVL